MDVKDTSIEARDNDRRQAAVLPVARGAAGAVPPVARHGHRVPGAARRGADGTAGRRFPCPGGARDRGCRLPRRAAGHQGDDLDGQAAVERGAVRAEAGTDGETGPAAGAGGPDRRLRSGRSRVVLVKDPDSGKPYDLGLFTLDTAASPAAIAERYSWRWPIEPSNAAGKQLLGVGEACNRTARAVERTVPSGSSSRPCSSPGTPAPPPIPPTSPGAASSARGTPPRPRRRPATCSPGSAAARRGPDFGHLPRSEPP
jgi:hypothetical protein